jgi:hypothetical protein
VNTRLNAESGSRTARRLQIQGFWPERTTRVPKATSVTGTGSTERTEQPKDMYEYCSINTRVRLARGVDLGRHQLASKTCASAWLSCLV